MQCSTGTFNAIILDTVTHYVNKFQTDWDKFIPAIQFAYRSTPSDNSVGFSPFFLLYGREAVLPIDVSLCLNPVYKDRTVRDYLHDLISQLEVTREISKRNMESNQASMKRRYDKRAQLVPYQVGDVVYLYIPATQKGLSRKLSQFWCGPYLLVQKTGPVNFRDRNLENNKLLKAPIHVNRMKFAYDRFERPSNAKSPADLEQQKPIQDLEDRDCPESSFAPLKAAHTRDNFNLIPGMSSST